MGQQVIDISVLSYITGRPPQGKRDPVPPSYSLFLVPLNPALNPYGLPLRVLYPAAVPLSPKNMIIVFCLSPSCRICSSRRPPHRRNHPPVSEPKICEGFLIQKGRVDFQKFIYFIIQAYLLNIVEINYSGINLIRFICI